MEIELPLYKLLFQFGTNIAELLIDNFYIYIFIPQQFCAGQTITSSPAASYTPCVYFDNQTTMKILTIILLLTLPFNMLAQDKIVGHYRDHFNSRIQLNADNTFEYTWHLDLSASWSKGTWTIKNDTVCFRIIPTFDTISYKNKMGLSTDTLILSTDEIPERLTQEQYAGQGLSSGGQNRTPCPDKLFFKGQKLFGIKNGRLVKKKIKGFWTDKKWSPWFFKSDY